MRNGEQRDPLMRSLVKFLERPSLAGGKVTLSAWQTGAADFCPLAGIEKSRKEHPLRGAWQTVHDALAHKLQTALLHRVEQGTEDEQRNFRAEVLHNLGFQVVWPAAGPSCSRSHGDLLEGSRVEDCWRRRYGSWRYWSRQGGLKGSHWSTIRTADLRIHCNA